MTRILIPYFNAGFGHISFARAIETALRRRRPDWEIGLMDAGAEIPGERLTDLYVRSWQKILGQPGWVKSAVFGLNGAFPWAFAALNRRAIKEALPGLRQFLESASPDVVVPTHWGCGHLFSAARQDFGYHYPIVYLYTELAGAYKQIRCGADRYFCLTEESGRALRNTGIPADSIKVTDLIVQEELASDLPGSAESRRALGLEADRFTVLFSLGGEGIGSALPFLDNYYEHGSHAQILVLAGRNRAFLAELRRRYPARPGHAKIAPLGYLPDLKLPFASADLFLGKCGTSFAVESIRAGKPLLINNIGAPNEADNRDYMVGHGFAIYVPRPAEVTARIETLATDENLYRQALAPFAGVSRRNGADEIADYIIDLVSQRSRG